MRSFFVALPLLLTVPNLTFAQAQFFQPKKQRILILGDSNTFAGHYVTYLDVYLYTHFPEKDWELLNVGLPSETASGLSEPDHPFPRPSVHTRIDKALAKTKPDIVFACYGMNDGIYHPNSKGRFAAYKSGILKVVKKAQQTGAKVVLVTTPPFDPVPVRKRLAPANAKEFSYRKPFARYDEVLTKYSQWLVGLRKKKLTVIDVHTPTNKHLKAVRKTQPKYRLAGDGIHPNHTGHWIMAAEILLGLNACGTVADILVDAKTKKVRGEPKVKLKRVKDGFDITWKSRLPMPIDSRWPKEFPKQKRYQDKLNRYRLTVKELTPGKYDLLEGDKKLGRVTAEDLEKGIDLTRFPALSTNRRAQKVLKLAGERQRILGRSWLSHIGHKRLNTPKGMPLEKAKDQSRKLEQQIRKLAEPSSITLRLLRAVNE